MNWRIETLTAESAELLERLDPNVFDHPIIPEQLQAFIDDPRHVLVMAVATDTVVGMGSGVEYFHPDKAPQFWINEVGVANEYRRQGIGRALTAALIEEAKSRGCSCAWLGTETDNVPANACYKQVPGGNTPEPFVLYEWPLD